MTEIKDRLARAMEIKGFNATELAIRSGLSTASISRYLNGIMVPKRPTAIRLAQILGVSPVWLLGFDTTTDGQPVAVDLNKLTKENKIRLLAYYQALLDTQGGVHEIS